MVILSHISSTIDSLKLNRMRNFLTILGIAIGSCCISIILSLADGSRQVLIKQIRQNNEPNLIVKPIVRKTSNNGLFSRNINSWNAISSLSETDKNIIAENEYVKSVSALMPIRATIKVSKELQNQLIIATDADFAETVEIEMAQGQFLENNIIENAVVLGSELAKSLFSTTYCVGQVVKISGQNFTVIGVTKKINEFDKVSNIDLNNTAFIDYATGLKITNGTGRIEQFNVLLNQNVDPVNVKNSLFNNLLINHQNEENFMILTAQDSEHPVNANYEDLTKITLLIATVAMVVGGIGLMNIMLVNVAERIKEIGVRRSIGASGFDIIIQFLLEAIVLSFLGGLLGIGAGFGLTMFYSDILPTPAIFTWELVAKVLAVSVGVGAISGLTPAIKAATQKPIESLRQL